VETKAGEVRVAKAEGGGEKRRSRKEIRREGTKEKKKQKIERTMEVKRVVKE